MRIEYDIKLGFKDVMIRPKRSTLKSRAQVNLDREFKFLHSTTVWKGIPIMAANMDTVGTFEMALTLSKHKLFIAIHKHYSIQEWEAFLSNAPKYLHDYIAISTGTGKHDAEKLKAILELQNDLKFICIDVANGYSEHFVNFVKQTRNQYPDKVIIAGNVVTGEMVEELLLAGHDESGGDIVEKNGKTYKLFYGMSSETAMDKHVGGVAEYRASEGKTVEVPYRGKVETTLQDILGGVRSTCTYVGAQRLKELTKRTTFIRVEEQENRVYNE